MRVFISGGTVTLQAVLAELYTDRQSAERLAREAGLDTARVAWSPRMDDTWHSLVEEARMQSRLYDLTAVPAGEAAATYVAPAEAYTLACALGALGSLAERREVLTQ